MEIDPVASVAKEADVLGFDKDSDEEHVSDTSRLPRPRASRPKAAAHPEAYSRPKYPPPGVTAHPEDPELFVITQEILEN